MAQASKYLLAGILLIASGCASFTQNRGQFLTEIGELNQGKIAVSVQPDQKLRIKRDTLAGNVETSPSDWTAHPGWFVFMRNKEVWAYDGQNELLLVTVHTRGQSTSTSVYGTGNFPVNIPKQVANRLKQPVRVLRQ